MKICIKLIVSYFFYCEPVKLTYEPVSYTHLDVYKRQSKSKRFGFTIVVLSLSTSVFVFDEQLPNVLPLKMASDGVTETSGFTNSRPQPNSPANGHFDNTDAGRESLRIDIILIIILVSNYDKV